MEIRITVGKRDLKSEVNTMDEVEGLRLSLRVAYPAVAPLGPDTYPLLLRGQMLASFVVEGLKRNH